MSSETRIADDVAPVVSSAEVAASPGGDVKAEKNLEADETGGAPLKKVVSLQDQSSRLPPKKLYVITLSLVFAIFLSSFEQVSVSTTLPGIAKDFGASTAISWVGTAFLIANISSQIIYSRLSDIFGRKILLMCAISIFTTGNLLCGFAKNFEQLIVFRVWAGLGGGGINVLVLIIMSDIVSLKERGKYQAFVGVGVALGGALGPLLGGLFTQKVTWRWVFWVTVPVSCFSLVQIFFLLPLKPVTGSFKSKLKKVDFAGAFVNVIATTFILVPISSGGSSFPWSSPMVITLLVLGVVALGVFIIIEWKFAALPILPLRLFKHRSLFLLAWISFLAGIYYYVTIYFLPIYFQVTLNPVAGPLLSSGLLQALLLPQIASALAAGFVVQRLGHYNPVLWLGYGVYLIGAGVQTTFNRNSSHAYIAGILLVEGFGVGWTIQTALVAAQALAHSRDRAVITGIRNLFRFTGGAFGLVISSAIMNNIIKSTLADSGIPENILGSIRGAEFNVPPGLTQEQMELLLDAEMAGIKGVFWLCLAVSAITLLLSFGVEDKGLPGDEKREAERKAEQGARGNQQGGAGTSEVEDEGQENGPRIEKATSLV